MPSLAGYACQVAANYRRGRFRFLCAGWVSKRNGTERPVDKAEPEFVGILCHITNARHLVMSYEPPGSQSASLLVN